MLGLPTNDKLARSPRKEFCGFAQFVARSLFSTISAGDSLSASRSQHRHRCSRSRHGSLPFCRRSSAWLLSSGFHHRRPNWADWFRLWYFAAWTDAMRSFARTVGFSFTGVGVAKQLAIPRPRFRVRRAFSGRLRNELHFPPPQQALLPFAFASSVGATDFFSRDLGLVRAGCCRFRWGLLRLRRRRCLLGSLRFCFVRNDHFLRVDPVRQEQGCRVAR